jgi:hypothetical protein
MSSSQYHGSQGTATGAAPDGKVRMRLQCAAELSLMGMEGPRYLAAMVVGTAIIKAGYQGIVRWPTHKSR